MPAAQHPGTTPVTEVSLQDPVAHEVFGVPYASLGTTVQSRFVEVGKDAFMEVTHRLKWLEWTENLKTTGFEADWNDLFKVSWVAKALRVFKDAGRSHQYYRENVEPQLDRLMPYVGGGTTFDGAVQTDSLTPRKIRRTAGGILARQRTPIFPTIEELDTLIREEFVKLWKHRNWKFREFPTELTITSGGAIDINNSTIVFDGFASKFITIVGTNDVKRHIEWRDPSEFSDLMANYAGSTGTPLYFFDIDWGDTQKIMFLPPTDQAYTCYAVILAGPPAFTGLDDTTAINRMPSPFRSLFRRSVIAEMLSRWGREDTDAKRLLAQCATELETHTDNWADRGAHDKQVVPHHAQKWWERAASWNGNYIFGQMG